MAIDTDRLGLAIRLAQCITRPDDPQLAQMAANMYESAATNAELAAKLSALGSSVAAATRPAVRSAPSGSARSSDFKTSAKEETERRTGGPLVQVRGGTDTYRTARGKTVHLRSNKAYPRGPNESSYIQYQFQKQGSHNRRSGELPEEGLNFALGARGQISPSGDRDLTLFRSFARLTSTLPDKGPQGVVNGLGCPKL